jgi:hypothetical protein
VFPEAQQFLRSRNITTLKKAGPSDEPAARPASRLASEKTEPDLTRYFVTSHSGKVAHATIAHQIRSHWCCESRHWQRDALWREDCCLLRSAHAACALALLRTALQTLLRRIGQTSLAVVFEDVAHDPSLGLAWLMTRKLGG